MQLQKLPLLGCPSQPYQPGGGCRLRLFWCEEMRPWPWHKAGPGKAAHGPGSQIASLNLYNIIARELWIVIAPPGR